MTSLNKVRFDGLQRLLASVDRDRLLEVFFEIGINQHRQTSNMVKMRVRKEHVTNFVQIAQARSPIPVPASIRTSLSMSIAEVRDPAPIPPLQPSVLMRIKLRPHGAEGSIDQHHMG